MEILLLETHGIWKNVHVAVKLAVGDGHRHLLAQRQVLRESIEQFNVQLDNLSIIVNVLQLFHNNQPSTHWARAWVPVVCGICEL